ncbi:MAG: Flp pilus assembly protein CpaB [Actinomycetota bacterium]
MRRRPPRSSRVLLVLSLLVAAATTLALRDHLARVEARAAVGGPGVPVVVAARDLTRGTVLSSAVLREESLPARYRPPGALPGLVGAVGRSLAAGVVAGEVLTQARIAPPGGPVASMVPAGLRAVPVAVPIPRDSLAPGDRVDVLATYATGRPYTDTVAREAEVLDVLAQSSTDVGTATIVVLLVSPEVAERLAFARAFADLSVAVAPPQVTEAAPWTTGTDTG